MPSVSFHLFNIGLVKMQDWFVPGDRICQALPNHRCGLGTYERDGWICSKFLGCASYTNDPKGDFTRVEVHSIKESARMIPTVGSTVTCQITHVGTRIARCVIVELEGKLLRSNFIGEIRREDVRLSDVDKVRLCDMFRAGDRVRARVVLEAGEQAASGGPRAYFLTTAANELGVISCRNEKSGVEMVPISWCEFQCPVTFEKQSRKVAKPVPTAATA